MTPEYSAAAAALLADIADRLYADDPDWRLIDQLKVVLRPSPDPQELARYMEPEFAPDLMEKIREEMKATEERKIYDAIRRPSYGTHTNTADMLKSIYSETLRSQLTVNPSQWTWTEYGSSSSD